MSLPSHTRRLASITGHIRPSLVGPPRTPAQPCSGSGVIKPTRDELIPMRKADYSHKTTWKTEFGENNRYVIRPLEFGDFDKNFPHVLNGLTEVGTVTKEQFRTRFSQIQKAGDLHHVVVIEDTQKAVIIACATLFVELKFIHECSQAGHVEDVVVDPTYRGLKLGRRILEALAKLGRQLGCYKIILDCGDHNVSFYEKLGYSKKEVCMAVYL